MRRPNLESGARLLVTAWSKASSTMSGAAMKMWSNISASPLPLSNQACTAPCSARLPMLWVRRKVRRPFARAFSRMGSRLAKKRISGRPEPPAIR